MNDGRQPLLTFALFAYQHEHCVAEAIAGALSQTYQPLEIILSDDASRDGTFEVIQRSVEHYSGPHRLVLNRNEKNQGLASHVNRVMDLAQGELVILAAGDDISHPERTARIYQAWESQGRRADLLCSEYEILGRDGQRYPAPLLPQWMWQSAEQVARNSHCPLGATCTWTRRLWQAFGHIPLEVRNEDQLMAFRALMAGGIQVVEDRLVTYREGSADWNVREGASSEELSRHHRKIAPFQIAVAEAMVADAERKNRHDLAKIARRRLLECRIVHNIYNESTIHWGRLVYGLMTGCRFDLIGKPFVERYMPGLVRRIRQRRQRQSTNAA